MKITIELNMNDIVSAKAEHLNQALAAMQVLAADSIETEAPAAEAVKAEPVTMPAESVVKVTPDAEKVEAEKPVKAAEKPVKAAEKHTTKKQTAKKAEPVVKAEEPAVEAEEEAVEEPTKEPDKDMGEPKDIPEPTEEPKTEPIDRDALTTKLRDLVHADRSRSKAIKAILQKHGVTKVHELSDEDLASVVEEAEQL